jgi:hypothetical protein
MEVESGESEDHECELAVSDINDLINGAMKPSFNPSELGMVYLGRWRDGSRYQINADERLEDKIVIWGHLPFELR